MFKVLTFDRYDSYFNQYSIEAESLEEAMYQYIAECLDGEETGCSSASELWRAYFNNEEMATLIYSGELSDGGQLRREMKVHMDAVFTRIVGLGIKSVIKGEAEG